MGRWLAVRIVARGLRKGIAPERALGSVARAFWWYDSQWHMDLLNDAVKRNERKLVRA